MSTKTGGPAFPLSTVDPYERSVTTCDGMTMRDYFAAKAMQAATTGHISYYGHESNHWQVSDIASYAYELADAMLKAKETQC